LLPDEWNKWSGLPVFLDEGAFGAWLDGIGWDSIPPGELPAPHDLAQRPANLRFRPLPELPFVTLSEALTWVAFGIALDRDRLDRALNFDSLPSAQPEETLAESMAKLAAMSTGGAIEFRGKHRQRYNEDRRSLRVQRIDPVELANHACFDIVHDGLEFGKGLAWGSPERSFNEAFEDRPEDTYCDVSVQRAALLAGFPPIQAQTHTERGRVPPNRTLDHEEVKLRAAKMREERPAISKGSAAASIIAEIGPNPRTNKPWNNRHIERLIQPLWPDATGGDSDSPPI
jgi:hypothetical protein